MKLRLHDDAYLAPVDDGTYIIAPRERTWVGGTSFARWVEALSPWLDGRFTAAELGARFPDTHTPALEAVLGRLRDAGAVVEEPTGPPPLDAPVRERFAPELSYLAAHHGDAAAAFGRFRDLSVAVLAEAAWAAPIREHLRSAGVLRVDTLPLGADGVRAEAVTGRDLVVAVVADPARLLRLDARCAGSGAALAAVLPDGADLWLPPVADPRADPGDPLAPARPGSVLDRSPGPRPPVEPTAAHREVVAAAVARSAFHWATGTGTPRWERDVIRIGPDLAAHRHHCLRHPRRLPVPPGGGEGVRDRVASLRDRPAAADAEFARTAVRAADDVFGLFRYLPDDGAAQSPVHVAEAQIRDPLSDTGWEGAAVVRAVAFDYATARIEAARSALTWYAERFVDPRRLVDAPDGPHGLVAGYDPVADRVVRVPAAAVFPRLSGPAAGTAAAAAGESWDAALDRALAGLWWSDPQLVGDTAGRPVRVDPATLDEAGRRCALILAELGELPQVYDHGGRHGVTALSFRRGDLVLERTAGPAGRAWTDGLLRTLFTVQRWIHGDLRRPPQATAPRAPATGEEVRADPAAPDPGTVLAALAAAGRTAVVVPLDHDPAAAALLPHTLKVVLL
ncbi:hypothetical protein ABZ249_23995 [Nocardiopsis sp. NPDC006139]|uniref:hypothetical protein n=1 Tax=Nocardiopsis sp. NPDC006139 TaxID=3154578 RepID=UPI00339E0781